MNFLLCLNHFFIQFMLDTVSLIIDLDFTFRLMCMQVTHSLFFKNIKQNHDVTYAKKGKKFYLST